MLLAAAGLTRGQSQNPDLSQIPQSQVRSLVVVSPLFLTNATLRPKLNVEKCNLNIYKLPVRFLRLMSQISIFGLGSETASFGFERNFQNDVTEFQNSGRPGAPYSINIFLNEVFKSETCHLRLHNDDRNFWHHVRGLSAKSTGPLKKS